MIGWLVVVGEGFGFGMGWDGHRYGHMFGVFVMDGLERGIKRDGFWFLSFWPALRDQKRGV